MKTIKLIKRTLLGTLTISALFFTSCSKDRIDPDQNLNAYESMNDYYDSKKQDEQEFTIDTSGTDPIIGKEKTKIWPSKEKLMFANGDSVQWPYTIKLVELYPAKEMLYYQVMNETTTEDFFSCKGEVRIRAFKDGEELVLRPNETWNIELADTLSNSNINIYYEDKTYSTVKWNSSNEVFIDSEDGYTGQISPLGWIAGGKASSGEAATTISLTSAVDDLTTVRSYVYIPSKESITEFTGLTSIALPENETVKIICMAMDKNQKLFHFYKETTAKNGLSIDVTMTEISDESLTSILDSL